ncbi:MAG: LytTR family DNA-binding domain-containing protein [Bacteroidota bacterium]
MKVILIEDEINAYEYLKTILPKTGVEIEILAHLDSVQDSVNWLDQHEAPDLIFLDIQLADGLSFEIFNHVEVKAPIIFTTAYDQYAIDAFKFNSIDYLLKPIHVEDLKKALKKYQDYHKEDSKDLRHQLQALMGNFNQQKKNRCLVKRGDHFEFVDVSDIVFVNSEESITFLHTRDTRRHIYNHTLEGLMISLDPQKFFQINRHQIVNIDSIHKIYPYFNQRLKLELNVKTGELDFIVSRSKLNQFKSWVDS